uniref:Small subunit ribosomal protein S30e n=1 Tax=Schistosoma japonicum TaxID=6182 RepID=C1LTB1_SCHJA|nr:small subunit ribosomal protein S30e [Schistosoma japonicum]
MQLVVKSFDTRVIDTNNCPTAANFKILLANLDNLPLDSLQLYNCGSLISDCQSLASLPSDACIDVVVPVLGGKVHGSLARAGKVRGQTPKVEKQEKRKSPRGRAKRRMQYNKRFVAVVQQPGGRRRGPNSNVKST